MYSRGKSAASSRRTPSAIRRLALTRVTAPPAALSSPGARHASPLVVVLAFVLLAAANMRSHLRRILRHPMLIGVGLWALVHLLANGHAKATILFGAFLVYAALDLGSAVARGAVKTFVPQLKYDFMAIGGGIGLALLVMWMHRILFGVAPVPWSL